MSYHLGVSQHQHMLLGLPYVLFISCKLDQPPFHFLHGKGLAQLGHLNLNNPSSRWKKSLRAQMSFAVAAVATALPAEKTLRLLEEQERENITSDVGIIDSDLVVPGDEENLDYKERIRRIRISNANKGKVPWNKGRKHNPETLELIRERTKQAMKNPKIRQKLVLAQCSRPQSEETKERIRVALQKGWEGRRERFLLQGTCIIEWKEAIAEAARRGGDCEEELLWDSYKILKERMHQEWLQDIAMRKKIAKEMHGRKRACKSAEQRLKISKAIRAKWADPGYQENVRIGMKKASANKRSNTLGRLKERKVVVSKVMKKERAPKPRKTAPNQTPVTRKLCDLSVPPLSRKKLPPPYSDPLSGAKLQMIKQLRVNRAAMELRKQEATERARLLIAEAEKAAKALEAVAVTDAKAKVFLSETRRLLDEAVHSMQSAESGGSVDASFSQRGFVRSAHMETFQFSHSIDSSEVASAAVVGPADSNGPLYLSPSKSRELEENHSLRFAEKSSSNDRLTRSMSHDAYQQRCRVSTQNLQNSVNSSLLVDEPITANAIFEKMPEGVVTENNMLHIAMTPAGPNSTSIADGCMMEATAWKHELRSVENIRKDVVPYVDINSCGTSLVNDEYSTQNITRKSEARLVPKRKDGALCTEKKIEKKWVRGRLVEVKDD